MIELAPGLRLSPELALLLAAALAGALLSLALGLALNRDRARRAARLGRVVARAGGMAGADGLPAMPSLRVQSREKRWDRLLSNLMPRPERMRARLEKTGTGLTPGRYLAISGVVALGLGAGLFLGAGFAPLLSVLIGLAGGVLLPHVWVGGRIAARRQAFIDKLPEGIDIITRGLRAGLPVSESIAAVGREAPEPVAGVFRLIGERIQVGDTLDQAVTRAARRMDANELKYLAIVLQVQRETGGNLAETLANLSDILRRRRQMKLKVRALSSEARASAYILGALPFIMFGVILVVNAGYVLALFEDPRGHVMIAGGLMSIAMGVGVMARMIRFDI